LAEKEARQQNNDAATVSAPPPTAVTGVTLKIALDAQGGAADLSTDVSERFTCEASLDMVHRLRCAADAVLVGRGTVEADDPSLTVRRVHCPNEEQPLRVVLDPSLSLILESSDQYKLFRDGLPTVVYHCIEDVDDSLLDLDEDVVTIVYVPPAEGLIPVADVVEDLQQRCGVRHLMVEGGPATAGRFLREKLIDRCILVKAPLCFRKPLPAGITDDVLQDAGLTCLGKIPLGVDEMECWSRPDEPWPTEELSDWP
jgi:diaminohydroxyphosphoribosylaminopyrimidine deaminase/5-amino-6-(5-phosphoribosylamino)uracil reductase